MIVMIVVGIGLGFVPSVFQYSFPPDQFLLFQFLPSMESALKFAVAAFAGAYIARVPFIIPTIAYLTVGSLWSFHILVKIAEVVQPISFFEVAARNSLGTAIALIAAVIGAELGTRLSITSNQDLLEAI